MASADLVGVMRGSGLEVGVLDTLHPQASLPARHLTRRSNGAVDLAQPSASRAARSGGSGFVLLAMEERIVTVTGYLLRPISKSNSGRSGGTSSTLKLKRSRPDLDDPRWVPPCAVERVSRTLRAYGLHLVR
jgi:hypothetical protein